MMNLLYFMTVTVTCSTGRTSRKKQRIVKITQVPHIQVNMWHLGECGISITFQSYVTYGVFAKSRTVHICMVKVASVPTKI